jgi:YfiH family protein
VLPRGARKRYRGLPARLIFHFDVSPAHSLAPARSERFHRRLFGRKSRRVPLEFFLVPLAVMDFTLREHALQKRLSVPPDRRLDAVNFRDVHSHSDDHGILRRSSFDSSQDYTFIMVRAPDGRPLSMTLSKARAKKPPARKPPARSASAWRISHSCGLHIIQAKPFEQFDWLIHGFSTRAGGTSILETSGAPGKRSQKLLNLGFTGWDLPARVEANRHHFLEAIGAKTLELVTLRQVHSDVVHVLDTLPAEPPTGDALISRAPRLLLAIQTADCIPILLVDPRHRAIAAVHAGWRGTLARIAAKTVGRMQMEFSTNPAGLLAALGPGIHQCCYEVGPDVVKEFAAQFPNVRAWFDGPFDILASGEDPNPLPWLSMMPPGHEIPPPRCRLDLYAANAAILAAAGVNPKNIFSTDFCTACRTDLLFSYRREGPTGRLLSAIGIV